MPLLETLTHSQVAQRNVYAHMFGCAATVCKTGRLGKPLEVVKAAGGKS